MVLVGGVSHTIFDRSGHFFPNLRKPLRQPAHIRHRSRGHRHITFAAASAIPEDLSALERHVAFFDVDRDGLISPVDTYKGMRAIGAGPALSAGAAALINGALGWPSSDHWWPTLNIRVAGIQRTMHGSSSGVYDETGAFNADRFEEVFARYDVDGDGYWSWEECQGRAKAQRNYFDFFGQLATFIEFGAMFLLLGKDGKVSKEHLRGQYDGSLFYEMEEAVKKGKRL